MLARTLILKTSALAPVEKLVRKSFLFRPLVKRFIAGDTVEEALLPSEALVSKGFFVSLDYLGENTKSEAEALEAKASYIRMLQLIKSSPVSMPPRNVAMSQPSALALDTKPIVEPCNISIKLTQCGLDQGTDFAESNYREVLTIARDLGIFVRVDMEASEYTERTVQMMERILPDFKNTGTVLQSYLYRTPEDVERMIELKARVRIVKGAYLEPTEVAHQDKAKVDEAYVQQAKRLLESGFYPAIATHDETIIDLLNKFVAEKKIEKASFEYQMLFGIRRDLQDRLLGEGYNVRVYVPYGDSWYPYFTRRLAERPANTLFILKSMFRG